MSRLPTVSTPKVQNFAKSEQGLYGFALRRLPLSAADRAKLGARILAGLTSSAIAAGNSALAAGMQLGATLSGGLYEPDYVPDNVVEMRLPLNPEHISLTEPYGHDVTVTGQGSIHFYPFGYTTGKLSVRGTTGYYRRQLQSLEDGVGTLDDSGIVDKIVGETGLDLTRTGMYHAHCLRRFFHTYDRCIKGEYIDKAPSESGIQPSGVTPSSIIPWGEDSLNMCVVWANLRDDEYFIVLPTSVVVERDSADPMLYRYNLEFDVLGEYRGDSVPFDTVGLPNPVKTFNSSMDALQGLASSIYTAGMGGIASSASSTALKDYSQDVQKLAVDSKAWIEQRGITVYESEKSKLGSQDYPTTLSGNEEGGKTVDTLGEVDTGVIVKDSIDGKQIKLNGEWQDADYRKAKETAITTPVTATHIHNRVTDIVGSRRKLKAVLSTEKSSLSIEGIVEVARVDGLVTDSLLQVSLLSRALIEIDENSAKVVMKRIRGDFGLVGREEKVQEIKVLHGESIYSFALRVLGNSSRWREIAALNNLVYPYISEAGLPGTLAYGDVARVPSFAGASGYTVLESSRQMDLVDDLSMGVDIRLENGDWVLGRGNDVQLDGGTVNLERAIQRRVGTEKGAYQLAPLYGMASNVGNRVYSLLGKTDFVSAILRDPRVAGTRSVGYQRDGDVEKLAALIIPKTSNKKYIVEVAK